MQFHKEPKLIWLKIIPGISYKLDQGWVFQEFLHAELVCALKSIHFCTVIVVYKVIIT